MGKRYFFTNIIILGAPLIASVNLNIIELFFDNFDFYVIFNCHIPLYYFFIGVMTYLYQYDVQNVEIKSKNLKKMWVWCSFIMYFSLISVFPYLILSSFPLLDNLLAFVLRILFIFIFPILTMIVSFFISKRHLACKNKLCSKKVWDFLFIATISIAEFIVLQSLLMF